VIGDTLWIVGHDGLQAHNLSTLADEGRVDF
jgi:hypothetical protein